MAFFRGKQKKPLSTKTNKKGINFLGVNGLAGLLLGFGGYLVSLQAITPGISNFKLKFILNFHSIF